MAIILTNRTRSFGTIGTTTISKIKIKVVGISPKQRVLPGAGLTDVIDGVLIQPISIKYPGLGLIRWVSRTGVIQGVESVIEFKETNFFPPNPDCFGFEIYVVKGTVFDVEIDNQGGSMDLTDYYTKAEVNALFAGLPPTVDAYTKAQTDTLLALKQPAGSYYTQSQVNALIPTVFRGFDYDQVSVPSNPTNGQTWRERASDNKIVLDWSYDTTDGVWKSIRSYENTLPSLNVVSASTTLNISASGLPGYFKRIEQISTSRLSSAANSAANYWSVLISALVDGSSVTTLLLDTKTDAAATRVQSDVLATDVFISTGFMHSFRVAATKFASAPSLSLSGTIRWRYTRP